MHETNEEKTSFITKDGTYCYQAMPFELKNTGATYQWLMNKIFKYQIGRNAEVYVDNTIIRSWSFKEHVKDLKEIFTVLDKYRMKLNPAKCAFFIKGEKFMGYMVSAWGIELNLEKVRAILDMPQSTCIRDVQRLTRRIIVLKRFMSKSTEKCLRFFKKLRKSPNFEWIEEC